VQFSEAGVSFGLAVARGGKGFPAFMKHPAHRIAASAQSTCGVDRFVFDGADGSQMAFWTCAQTAKSREQVHQFDEYMVVVEACYTLIIEGNKIPLRAGEQYFVPRGVRQSSGFRSAKVLTAMFGTPSSASFAANV